MNRKAVFASVFVVIIILASLFVFMFLNQRPRQEIKIGAILPLSGSDSSVGQDIKLVTELAVDIINNEYDLELPLARTSGLPNFGGAKIKVIWGTVRAASRSQYQKLKD